MSPLTSRWLAIGAVGAVAACHAAASVYFVQHNPYVTQIGMPCPILTLTGWQCPGCGSTRALYSLLHGDPAKAFSMNPLLLACYASGSFLVAMTVAERLRRPRLARTLSVVAIGLVAVAAVYTGVIRNLIAI
jgi:hypothetical protein